MSQVFIRDTLVEQLELWRTSNPTVEVFYEDTTSPDLDSISGPFVHAEFAWVEDEQIELASGPNQKVRSFGFLELRIFSRVGAGSRARLVIAESLKQHFQRRNFSGVQTKTPQVRMQEEAKGWMALPIVISFYRDTP